MESAFRDYSMKHLPALAIALTLLGCGVTPETTTTNPAPTEPATTEAAEPEAPENKMTLANYEAIVVDGDVMDGVASGSTKDEVFDLLGEGELQNQMEMGGIVNESYTWKGQGGFNFVFVSVTFQDGNAISKTQTGLE